MQNKGKIYYPNCLNRNKITLEKNEITGFPKKEFQCSNSELEFHFNIWHATNKIIELAMIFDCVYLDICDFVFLIKNMLHTKRDIALFLINAGKISFVNSDIYSLYYKVEDGMRKLRLYANRKDSFIPVNKMINVNNDNEIQAALAISEHLSIEFHANVDGKFLTTMVEKEIALGYYQGIGIGINKFLNVNSKNGELYNLIAELYLFKYICELNRIENLYLSEYMFCIEKLKVLFNNSLSITNSSLSSEKWINVSKYLYDNDKGIEDILSWIECSGKQNEKIVNVINCKYEQSFLNNIYCVYPNSEYKADCFRFKNYDDIPIKYVSFANYLSNLSKEGVGLRTTKCILKIMKFKYLKNFLYGNIKFSKPRTFIESENNFGQNDILEGTVCATLDENSKAVYYTRNENDLDNTLIWCGFGLDDFMFIETPDGNIATIERKFFDDYIGRIDRSAYLALPKEEQYCIVMIQPDVFVERVYEKLLAQGVQIEDIHISPVVYINKHQTHSLKCGSPEELFYKHISYLSQNEIRILINNYNKYSTLFDEFNIFNIGDISDICYVVKGIYFEDLKCIKIGENQMIFKLPE